MVDGICAPLSPPRSHQGRSSILFCPTTSLLQGLLGIGTGECCGQKEQRAILRRSFEKRYEFQPALLCFHTRPGEEFSPVVPASLAWVPA